MANDGLEYVGFWLRVGASVLDTLLIMVVMYPLLVAVYGWAYFRSEKLIQGSDESEPNRLQCLKPDHFGWLLAQV